MGLLGRGGVWGRQLHALRRHTHTHRTQSCCQMSCHSVGLALHLLLPLAILQQATVHWPGSRFEGRLEKHMGTRRVWSTPQWEQRGWSPGGGLIPQQMCKVPRECKWISAYALGPRCSLLVKLQQSECTPCQHLDRYLQYAGLAGGPRASVHVERQRAPTLMSG